MFDFIAQNYTLIIVILGTTILGLAAGVLGVFSILRRQALAGDALSHASLPGIVLAYMITQNMSMPLLLLGAAFASVISMLLIETIKRYSKIKYDAALALILSAFFGLGQVLIQVVQSKGSQASAGLEKFIFGQAALMLRADVYFIIAVALIVLVAVIFLWKEIKVFVFNEDFAANLGFSPKLMSIILNMLTVIVVVIGLRTVGVILMSALIIAPGVASRQWSHRLSINAILAGIFGMLSGLIGTYLSYQKENMPTGPVIVVVLSALILCSLFLAPKRGMLKSFIQDLKYKREIKQFRSLIHIYTQEDQKALTHIDTRLIDEGYLKVYEQKIVLTDKGNEMVERLIGGER